MKNILVVSRFPNAAMRGITTTAKLVGEDEDYYEPNTLSATGPTKLLLAALSQASPLAHFEITDRGFGVRVEVSDAFEDDEDIWHEIMEASIPCVAAAAFGTQEYERRDKDKRTKYIARGYGED